MSNRPACDAGRLRILRLDGLFKNNLSVSLLLALTATCGLLYLLALWVAQRGREDRHRFWVGFLLSGTLYLGLELPPPMFTVVGARLPTTYLLVQSDSGPTWAAGLESPTDYQRTGHSLIALLVAPAFGWLVFCRRPFARVGSEGQSGI